MFCGKFLLTNAIFLWVVIAARGDIPIKQKLKSDLFSNYDPMITPRRAPFAKISVQYRLRLRQIIEVEEPKQHISVSCWITETWDDDFLYWNPAEYANVTYLTVPHHIVWIPDTVLFNSVQMRDDETRNLMDVKVMTQESGVARVQMMYPAIFVFYCPLAVFFFPFDTQNCSLTISSWTEDTSVIEYDYSPDSGSLTEFVEHEEWTLINFKPSKQMIQYECCPSPWSLLQFTMIMRRKPLLYIVHLVIPTTIISLISIIGFFSATSSASDRTEKVTMGITTLLAMSILMLTVSDKMPTTSSIVPLIECFFLSMMGLIALGTIGTTIVVALEHKGSTRKPPGPKLKKTVAIICRLFKMDIPGFMEVSQPSNQLKPGQPNGDSALAFVPEDEEARPQTATTQLLHRALLNSGDPASVLRHSSHKKHKKTWQKTVNSWRFCGS